MEEVHKVMQQKLGKHLDAMKSDIVKDFPDEDPEICLLHWICDRYGVTRPKIKAKIQPEQKEEDKTPARGRCLTVESHGLVADAELTEVKCRTLRASPKTKMNKESMLIEKLNAEQFSPGIPASEVAGYCVEDDAWRFQESMECIRTSQERVTGTIAKLRTQLRGKFISRIPLLVTSVLTDMDRYWLVGKLRPWNFKAGEVVVEQGDVGDKLYIIERGTCEVIVNGNVVDTNGREDFFGELAVMYASPRSATVRAKTEVTLLSLSRDDLFSTISEDKVAELAVVARARLFTGVPLLSALSAKKKEFVTGRLRQESWQDGAVLARQGHLTSGDKRRMYIILDGLCRKEVRKSSFVQEEEEAGVETIRNGQFFNMFAMWYNCPCSATITTIGDVQTLSISYDELNDICMQEISDQIIKRELTVKSTPKVSIKSNRSSVQSVKQLDESVQSETMRSIQYAMWIHILKLFFLKVDMPSIAYNSNALALVCEQSEEETFKTWDPVFRKGVHYDKVYILETGAISEHESDIETLRDAQEVGDGGTCIHHTAPGTCFGTMCLQGKERNMPTSTATASQETMMLTIPGDILRRMLRNGSLT